MSTQRRARASSHEQIQRRPVRTTPSSLAGRLGNGGRPIGRRAVASRSAVLCAAVGAALLATVALAAPAGAASFAVSVSDAAASSLTWWKAAVLGIVEVVTEYLPISSTGHLLVTARLLGLPSAKDSAGLDAVNTYVVAIQLGAILAVLGLFWKRFQSMLLGLIGRDDEGRHLLFTLVLAFVPSAVVGAVLDHKIEQALFGPWPVVAAWIVGGSVILILEGSGRIPRPSSQHPGGAGTAARRSGGARPDPTSPIGRTVRADRVSRVRGRNATSTNSLAAITYRQALIIGVAQCVALWPGTSRSLTTIVAALLLGIAMPVAVEFSFLLGFATLSAATMFKLAKGGGNLLDTFGVLNPLIGMAFAFVAAALSIRWLVTYLQRHDLTIFAWYRFAVAALTIALLASGVI